MKFVMLSDVHLTWENPIARKDNVVEKQWRKLQQVYDFAKDKQATVLIAGDLTQGPRSWKLLPELLDFYSRNNGVNTIAVRGQHDGYLRNKEQNRRTLLGALEELKYIQVIGDGYYDLSGWKEWGAMCIYGCGHGEELPELIEDYREYHNILIVHRPISDSALYPGHDYTHADRFMKRHPEFDLVLCGDIHKRFRLDLHEPSYSRSIINAGPMLRLEGNEYNLRYYPGFFYVEFDSDKEWHQTLRYIDLKADPPERVLSREHIETKALVKEMLSDFVKGVKIDDEEDEVDFEKILLQFIKDNKVKKSVIDKISFTMGKENE